VGTASVGLWGAEQYGIIGVRLYVLLEILRTLEGFAAEIALVRLQRNVHANVRGDVIALDSGSATVTPLAGQIQVVGTLATNMALTDVVLRPSQRARKTERQSYTRRGAVCNRR
jgi:L-rhamnose isomerase